MNQDILNLIIGFVLTTLLGGLLGSYLQQRSWKHQNEAHLKEEELKRASEVCESVSQLLDKRLYRMRRLYFACERYAQEGSPSKQVLDQKLQDYDAVLYEWNDRLNLNLALVGTYFGQSARVYLHDNIYESFKSVGSELEQAYREIQKPNAQYRFPKLLKQIDQLNYYVYRLGVFMMIQLRGGHVGRSAPKPMAASTLEESNTEKK